MGWVSPWELVVLIGFFLLLFGPKRLPEMGRSLGKGMREFKDSISGKDEPKHQELPAITPPPPLHEPVASSQSREQDPPA